MRYNDVIELSDAEFEEMAMLVDALEAGEDETLKAFQSLCPTGQEGVFDEEKVALYSGLSEKGLIQGVEQDGEFFFEKLTGLGVEAVGNGGKIFVNEDPDGFQSNVEEPAFAPLAPAAEQTEAPGKPEGVIAKSYKSGMLTVAIAAGFLAGIIGGAIAAVVVWSII